MTCKDCIHYEVCNGLCELWNLSARAEECVNFKNKSKYIELPCKVGDTVYVINNNRICAKDIVFHNKRRSIIAKQNEEYWRCVGKGRISVFYPENIGKTVFFTRAEAEAKLKELNENAK